MRMYVSTFVTTNFVDRYLRLFIIFTVYHVRRWNVNAFRDLVDLNPLALFTGDYFCSLNQLVLLVLACNNVSLKVLAFDSSGYADNLR